MSVATIDHTTDTATPDSRHRIVDVTAWLDHSASLRRPFTGEYAPRHRADGPAL
jgi:hypothetical protein